MYIRLFTTKSNHILSVGVLYTQAFISYTITQQRENYLSYDYIFYKQLLVCLFVCLFWIRNRIWPTGSTPKGGPTEISPTTQATPGLILHHVPCPPPPPPPILLSCILHQVCALPCLPVLYIYPNPEKVRYKAIGMEMNVVESCMKLVALGATQRKG